MLTLGEDADDAGMVRNLWVMNEGTDCPAPAAVSLPRLSPIT